MLTLNDGRSELWQWDTNRKLTVDAECSQVHLSNKVFGRSIDVDVVGGVAIIPDILLQTDKDLSAWAFVGTAENGYTKISKVFKVNKRNKPADYVFTPPEQTTLAEIMERLDDLESIQDPDAIKNAVDDYLANNPVIVEETDPTVPEWAKQPNPPDVKIPDKLPNPYSITFTGAVNASYDGSSAVEIKISDSGGNVDQSGKTPLDTFLDNTDVDYAYDADTVAYYTVIRIYKQKLDGSKQYPFVYAPNGAGAGDKSTYDMTVEDGWFLAINSGIFNTGTKKPDGILIQNGSVLQNSPSATHSKCKPLTIDGNGNLGYAAYDADAENLVKNGIVSAVCGFMPIIVDYAAVPDSEWNSVSHYTDNAQRQIIGQWGNGDYAIITCEGRNHHNSDGWTIAEAQSICIKHGLKFAYNLDGGGSTETMLGLKHINTIYESTTGRIVPTFIVFNGTDSFSNPNDGDATLTGISAVYSGGSVTVGTAVSSLTGIVVTAHYSDGTSKTVTGYTLSGTIAEGNNTVTVSYGGKTTTFTVTGVAESGGEEPDEPEVVTYTITNNLTNVTSNNPTASVEENASYSATLTAADGYELDTVTVIMGGTDVTSTVYTNGVVNISAVTGNVEIVAVAMPGIEGYTALSYIETDGNAYVTTGITEPETPWDIDYEMLQSGALSNQYGSGHVFSSTNNYYPFAAYGEAMPSFRQKLLGTESNSRYAFENDTWYKIQGRNNGTTYDSTLFDTNGNTLMTNSTTIGTTRTESNTFALFAYGGNPATFKYHFAGKLKYLKLSRSGVVEHYFVPVTEDATGTIGLLDRITGTFYSSATTTAFTGE